MLLISDMLLEVQLIRIGLGKTGNIFCDPSWGQQMFGISLQRF